MDEKLDIVAIGESLIELSTNAKMSAAGCLYKSYGGDALSTAIAALRMGSKVGFITRIGDDPFKDFLLDSWETEGLDVSQVKLTNEANGLYIIARPSLDEKEVVHYRKKIAPSKLSIDDINEDYIKNSSIIYASGVTQSLSPSADEAVEYAFKLAKDNNITTAYDPNYYSRLTTPDDAKEAIIKSLDYLGKKLAIRFVDNNAIYIIPVKDILYVTHDNVERKCLIKTDNRTYKVGKSLTEIKELSMGALAQSHRACLVNEDRIIKVDKKKKHIMFDNGEIVDLVSENYKREVGQLC